MSERIVVVSELPNGEWHREADFPEAKDARNWLRIEAIPGTYHILSFRDEDVVVQPAPPAPIRNEVRVGKQHLERGPRVAKGGKPTKGKAKGANGANATAS